MITRRGFIRISCLFPLALSLDPRERGAHTVEVRDTLMGTFVQVKGIGVDRALLVAAIDHMKGLEVRLTRFEAESEVSLFNRDGAVRKPSREFREIMEIARDGFVQTGGAFDITILPVLLHFEKHRKPLPDREKLRLREHMGMDDMVFSSQLIYSPKHVQVTLDGVAKGYIIDKGIERMREAGAVSVLLNIGGDMYCGDNKRGWNVGVYDPAADDLSKKLQISQMAVCTSGNYVNYFTEDKSLHHIIDPANLQSPNHAASVTVTASTACRADLLSTALFVTGPEGRRYLQEGERAYFT